MVFGAANSYENLILRTRRYAEDVAYKKVQILGLPTTFLREATADSRRVSVIRLALPIRAASGNWISGEPVDLSEELLALPVWKTPVSAFVVLVSKGPSSASSSSRGAIMNSIPH